MNLERIKLILNNLELLIVSLKEELQFEEYSPLEKSTIDDYDEVFED